MPHCQPLLGPLYWYPIINTLKPRQDGRHFPDDILKCIFFNENAWISLTISLKCVRKVRINNITSLVQIMAWRRPGDKPLSEPMMVSLLTHICATRPQWVKSGVYNSCEDRAPVEVPYHTAHALQLMRRSGARRFQLRVLDLPLSYSDLNAWQGTTIVALATTTNGHILR